MKDYVFVECLKWGHLISTIRNLTNCFRAKYERLYCRVLIQNIWTKMSLALKNKNSFYVGLCVSLQNHFNCLKALTSLLHSRLEKQCNLRATLIFFFLLKIFVISTSKKENKSKVVSFLAISRSIYLLFV